MPAYCSGCGGELLDDARFCPACGKQREMQPVKTQDVPVGVVVRNRSGKIGFKNPIMVIIFVFAILGFAYVAYTYVNFDGILSPTGSLSGGWEGSGTFTNNCDNPACRYVGTLNPPSVILDLQQNGNMVFGTVTINIPASQVQTLIAGQGCSGFDNSVSEIYNGVLSGNRLTFADLGGNIWTLNFLSNNCQGTVGSNDVGCQGLQGTVSLSKK
ncbi:MAG TPA: hypothetical protein DSN98_03225 [Thermoplasmata archaeon]|jgi:hypothetical protein|nr:MAG TPA: hypothetical protein DSN98_03225 [Thermoplasmata archaeon]